MVIRNSHSARVFCGRVAMNQAVGKPTAKVMAVVSSDSLTDRQKIVRCASASCSVPSKISRVNRMPRQPSSENFQTPRTRPALAGALARHRRVRGGETRYVFVRRDISSLARSRALSHIAGEAGFYFHQRYDLRRWACHFAALQVRHQRWFARRGARFVGLADGPRDSLAARVLEAATDRAFPDIVTGDENATSGRLVDADAILTYGLRVMHHFATRDGVNVPRSFGAARLVIGPPAVDEAAFEALSAAFRAAVTREIDLGVGDFQRLGPVAREWRVWFSQDAGGRGLGR
jgi:hypothetical protein